MVPRRSKVPLEGLVNKFGPGGAFIQSRVVQLYLVRLQSGGNSRHHDVDAISVSLRQGDSEMVLINDVRDVGGSEACLTQLS